MPRLQRPRVWQVAAVAVVTSKVPDLYVLVLLGATCQCGGGSGDGGLGARLA